jgi:hypothetical protein
VPNSRRELLEDTLPVALAAHLDGIFAADRHYVEAGRTWTATK